MRPREVAESIMAVKGWDGADEVLRESVTYRLVRAFTIAAKRRAIHTLENMRLWALMPQPWTIKCSFPADSCDRRSRHGEPQRSFSDLGLSRR